MPRALIIEDEVPSLEALVELVEREGFSTVSARSVAEARERLGDQSYELVLCDLLADAQPGEICFIAFVGDVYQHINPPAGFLQRFSDLGLEMKPASEALPPPRRGGPIRDQATGRPGRLYYATVTKLGASQVEVAGVRYSGPLAAGGYHAVVRKQGGRWVLDAKSKSGWVS